MSRHSDIQPGNRIQSSRNNKFVKINAPINCKSRNVVYIITCDKCLLQYIGKTERTLCERIQEHLGYIRIKHFNQTIGGHFNSLGHKIHHLKASILEILNSILISWPSVFPTKFKLLKIVLMFFFFQWFCNICYCFCFSTDERTYLLKKWSPSFIFNLVGLTNSTNIYDLKHVRFRCFMQFTVVWRVLRTP